MSIIRKFFKLNLLQILMLSMMCSCGTIGNHTPVSGLEAGGAWDIPKDKSKFHVFLLMGQSNMAGSVKGGDAVAENKRTDTSSFL